MFLAELEEVVDNDPDFLEFVGRPHGGPPVGQKQQAEKIVGQKQQAEKTVRQKQQAEEVQSPRNLKNKDPEKLGVLMPVATVAEVVQVPPLVPEVRGPHSQPCPDSNPKRNSIPAQPRS